MEVAVHGFCSALRKGLSRGHAAERRNVVGIAAGQNEVTAVPKRLGKHDWGGLLRSGMVCDVVTPSCVVELEKLAGPSGPGPPRRGCLGKSL